MKKIICLFVFTFTCTASTESKEQSASHYSIPVGFDQGIEEALVKQSESYEAALRRRAKSIVAALPAEKKVGQLIHVGLAGQKAGASIEKVIRDYHVGGIILFQANIGKAAEVTALNSDLQKMSLQHSQIPLLISVDQEGGRVFRVIDGATDFPGMMALGQTADEQLAYMTGFITGRQLAFLGFNFLFAPVLDVNNNPKNPVINTRSAGSQPGPVASIGIAYMRGAIDSGSLPTIKHFPGHGNTDIDSHLALPIVHRSKLEINEVELLPFRKAIEAKAPVVMVGHILFDQIDPDNPSTLSDTIVNQLLRTEMGFKGLTITDAMEMRAVSDRYAMGDAALKAVKAGIDIVLLTAQSDHIRQIYVRLNQAVKSKEIDESLIDAAVERQIYEKLKSTTGKLNWTGDEIVASKSAADSQDIATDSELIKSYSKLRLTQADAIATALHSKFGDHPDEAVLDKAVRSLRQSFTGGLDVKNSFVFYRSRFVKEEALSLGLSADRVLPIESLRQLWIRSDLAKYNGNWVVELNESDVASWNALVRRNQNKTNRIIVGLLAGSPFLPFQVGERAYLLCSFSPQRKGLKYLMKHSLSADGVTAADLILN